VGNGYRLSMCHDCNQSVVSSSVRASVPVSKMKVIVTGELCKTLALLSSSNPSMHHFAQEHLVFSELPSSAHLSGRPPTTPSLVSPIHVQGESVIIAN
jgi:hypothetical protein